MVHCLVAVGARWPAEATWIKSLLCCACLLASWLRLRESHSTWEYLFAHGDPEAAQRLRDDPAYHRDSRRLTLNMDARGTRGFSVTVDQLLRHKAMWIPDLDVFISTGQVPLSLAEHLRAIDPWRGKQVVDGIAREPEATFEQYAELWPDMGGPNYSNPHAPAPGHIVGITWDSAITKFGIDRGAGVWSDYGNTQRFRLWFDFSEATERLPAIWKGQHLMDGLPMITTIVEDKGVRYEVEQFAYPLDGPPAARSRRYSDGPHAEDYSERTGWSITHSHCWNGASTRLVRR